VLIPATNTVKKRYLRLGVPDDFDSALWMSVSPQNMGRRLTRMNADFISVETTKVVTANELIISEHQRLKTDRTDYSREWNEG
jgi:hypothetical protein